jgi:hypothetical protein
VKFLIDSMLPPRTASYLNTKGHDAVTPADLGAHNLPDDLLIQVATNESRVIVTENASDFAHVTTCPVVFVRKEWWSRQTLAPALAAALGRWAAANPNPGPWEYWLDQEHR